MFVRSVPPELSDIEHGELCMFVSRWIARAATVAVAFGIACSGAGTASALELRSGDGFIGAQFNQFETGVLSTLGVGHLIDLFYPPGDTYVSLGEGSAFSDDESGRVVAGTAQLIDEAAARGGTVSIDLNDPAVWPTRMDIFQDW